MFVVFATLLVITYWRVTRRARPQGVACTEVPLCLCLLDDDLCRNVGKIWICKRLVIFWRHCVQHFSQRMYHYLYIPEIFSHVTSLSNTFRQTFSLSTCSSYSQHSAAQSPPSITSSSQPHCVRFGIFLRSEIFSTTTIMITLFWDVTPFSLVIITTDTFFRIKDWGRCGGDVTDILSVLCRPFLHFSKCRCPYCIGYPSYNENIYIN